MPTLRRAVLSLVVVAAGAAAGGTAHAALPPGSTILLDRPSGDAPLPLDAVNSTFSSGARALSSDGNLAVFESDSDGLLEAGAPKDQRTVFVRDRAAGTVRNVCRATGAAGAFANAGCNNAAISPNGRYVTFRSPATNLDPAATSGTSQLYRRDLVANTTILISRQTGPAGAADTASGGFGAVADTGAVAFATVGALNPAVDTANSHADVYVRAGTTTTLVSRAGSAGAVGNNTSSEPDISGDGAVVAFESTATNFDAADTNARTDVYAVASVSGPVSLQSRKIGAATVGDGTSRNVSLSQNGQQMAFETTSTNLFSTPITVDTNNRPDVVLRDLLGNKNYDASLLSASTTQLDGTSSNPIISADGARVVFGVGGTQIGAPSNQSVAVVRNPVAATTTVASRADGVAGAIVQGRPLGISADGNVATFLSAGIEGGSFGQLYARVLATGVTDQLSRPGTGAFAGDTRGAVIVPGGTSADGRWTVFLSGTTSFTGLNDGQFHVFLRDARTRTTTLLDRVGGAGGSPAPTDVVSAVISADGSVVAFEAFGSGLVPEASDNEGHIYVWRRATGAVTVEDRRPDGTLIGRMSEGSLALSGDGRRIAFSTDAHLDPADSLTNYDVYVRDLVTGQLTFASRADGPSGAGAADAAAAPVLSADGHRVAFTASSAAALSPDDTNTNLDVYVRDLDTSQTFFVSSPSGGGAAGDGDSQVNSLSADGTRVAFTSQAKNLGDGDANNRADVHVRDLRTGVLRWVSARQDGGAGSGTSQLGSLSADGTKIAFVTDSTDLLGGTVGVPFFAVVRDLTTGNTEIGSASDGGSTPVISYSAASLSANGQCLAFGSTGANVVPGGYASPDFPHAFLRALGPDCVADDPPVATPSPAPAPSPSIVAKDTLAPTLAAFAAKSKTFSVKGKKPGTTLSLRSSEGATGVLSVSKLSTGKRKGKRCLPPVKVKGKAKSCVLVGKSSAVRTVTLTSGTNTVAFDGKVKGKRLGRGRYRLSVVATDAAGNRSSPVTIDITVR